MFRKLLVVVLTFLALTVSAQAANRTAWTAGLGQGLTWSSRTVAFGSTDLTGLVDGKSVLSTATAVANGTNLDIYADIAY